MKMNRKNAGERISFLRGEIERHNKHYYIENQPTISDFEYDLLLHELKALEARFPEFVSENSPTKIIGSDLPESNSEVVFKQEHHKSPMLSLSNTYDKLELFAFNERIKKITAGDFTYVCELKIDGAAISLSYSDGNLVKALTRGDGIKGENVTSNIKTIKSLPISIPNSSVMFDFDVRGEVFISWDTFEKINFSRESNEDALFANPRNAASGSLKLLDSDEIESRGLELSVYSVITAYNVFKTHWESLQWLKNKGFPVSEHAALCRDIDEVIAFIDYWNSERHNLTLPTDGVVIKVNEFDLQKQAGNTSKFPRWATAYKFKPERAVSKLLSVDYQVGRTGAVTPVANLEPVTLSGTIVKRASLHNSEQMELMDIHIGDSLYIEKGGEIIPKIVGKDISKRVPEAVKPLFPDLCPDCKTKLEKIEGEAKHYCPNNFACPTQIKGRFLHFSGRKAMNILAGEATIEQMYNLGYLTRLSDLYDITFNQLTSMEGWKQKSAERYLESIQKSLSTPFENVLFALGIRHIGETAAKNLANYFKNIDNLISASKEILLSVDDVGDIMADSVIDYFSVADNIITIDKLRNHGVKMAVDPSSNEIKSDKLLNKTFVISGVFSIPRESIKELIIKHSGKWLTSISTSADYLLAGEKVGPSKYEKAKKLGINIISEIDFFDLIK